MPRELILPVKDADYDREKLSREIENIKLLLPYIENLNTILGATEVRKANKWYSSLYRWEKIKALESESTDYYIFVKN